MAIYMYLRPTSVTVHCMTSKFCVPLLHWGRGRERRTKRLLHVLGNFRRGKGAGEKLAIASAVGECIWISFSSHNCVHYVLMEYM